MARPGGTRTHDAQFRKLSLYPAELRARSKMYYTTLGPVKEGTTTG